MAAKSTSNYLPTPILDTVRSNILEKITNEGGYAYVSMDTRATETNDISSAEAGLEMAWEQLHSGPWHSVLPIWRDAYAMSCLHVASFQYRNGDFKQALKVLDMGLIMGGNLLRQDLDSAINLISLMKSRISNGCGDEYLEVEEKKKNETSVGLFKCSSNVAEMLKVLPNRSLSCKTVEEKSSLSLEGFLCDYFLSSTPVIISDGMSHWPASKKWKDINYLKTVAGDRTVPVEVGKNYLCQDWKQEMITFSQFLDRVQSNECSPPGPTYLAQHPLFEQIQELRKDILVPDYCFVGGGELRSLNAWFGPAGTVTPLHHDPHHNILAQVVGRKYIRLYPASISEDLYPFTETMLCNSSQVDLDNLDVKQFPKAKDLEFMDCVLDEGQMLYIPPKWWHYVRSLTTSFSHSEPTLPVEPKVEKVILLSNPLFTSPSPESRDRLVREEPLTLIFPRRSVLGVTWVDNHRQVEEEERGFRRGRISSVLPTWYPRRPLGDITAVVDVIERRRSRLREANHQQNTTPLQLVSTPRAPLEHSLSLVTPKPAVKILSDEGDSDFRTPQQKLLDSIEQVEKIMKEEIKRMQSTPAAKKAVREKKVRVVMSMR
ncbi:Lysine-specific demethylase jmj30 [Thalictrum thalictroides]|uniref:Lysine-specific demethylase jmj30 n=1 Tax=Thalictrum thalictroides TaxID=46969 RepID=A0A7J6WDN9_THATH|nr:Lysine-specific demethylase jmj30 [Thalictrum thalictroides]